jgi:hypothetical protein
MPVFMPCAPAGLWDMSAVAAEQQAADLEPLDHTAVDPEPARPGGVVEARGNVRPLVIDALEFILGRSGVLRRPAERIAGDHAEAAPAEGEQAHETMLGRENVEIAVRQVAVDMEIAQRIILVERLALELEVERSADEAMRSLGADQPGRPARSCG